MGELRHSGREGLGDRGSRRGEETAMPQDPTFPFQRLDIYVEAKELARLVHEARIQDAELRDQATRVAKSTFLRLSEGLPFNGRSAVLLDLHGLRQAPSVPVR